VVDTTPETLPDAPLSEEEVTSILEEATTTEELVEALADLSPEQVSQVIEEILAEEPTQEQAAALATSSDVLAVVSTEEAAQIFEALNVEKLTDAQTEQLIEAIESAPLEIREQFEDTIDIFGEGLDDYTPAGSNIPVGERRTLIAATVGISLAAAGARIKR
jgi:anthranilate phosphoribosyltransferase